LNEYNGTVEGAPTLSIYNGEISMTYVVHVAVWSWISVQSPVTSASSIRDFLAEAYLDGLDNFAVVVHGVSFEPSDFGTWAYYSSAPGEHKRKKELNIEWDASEANFANQPFGVP
jgi:hypothetical protein